MASHSSYGHAILSGFDYLLSNYDEVFLLGQGLWSPWYVGNSMTDLDKKFGTHRVIDTPVSESACTAAALGAGLTGMKPVVVHPRMDFMLYALDAVVNQASKWSHMFGGQLPPNLTIRSIINRGGEHGAQHSQSLHSWFSHIPGLRVVMPSTVQDAQDLLVASVLSPDPVLYIDDRGLYEHTSSLNPVTSVLDLKDVAPVVLRQGNDISLVASSYSTYLAIQAADLLQSAGISCEVIDLRVINPLDADVLLTSVAKTRRLLVVDGGWSPCGLSSEIMALVCESGVMSTFLSPPQRVTLPFAPAPTSRVLEKIYYPDVDLVVRRIREVLQH